MKNRLLEQYVETVAANLGKLADAEREQQITELRQHLESLVTAAQTEGLSEKAATESALQQFGKAREVGADLNRSVWRMRLKRLPDTVVNALSVTAAMSITTLLFRYGVGPLIRAFVPPLPSLSDLPTHAVTVTIPHIAMVTPSLILGIAALSLLLFRDGVSRTFRGLTNLQTVAGAALLWVILSRLGGGILSLSIGHALLAKGLWDFETMQAIVPVFSIVPAAASAWIVTRIAPRSGIAGILSTFLVSTLTVLLDIAAQSGPTSLIFGPFLQGFALTSFSYVAAAMAFAFLASGLNRRQHHAQTA